MGSKIIRVVLLPNTLNMKKQNAFFFNTPVETSFIGHQLSEIYRDQVYVPFLQGKKDLTIIDIGANIGMTTYYFSRFAKVVHSVEPSLEHFETLKHMVKFNELNNVVLHKEAIWIKDTIEEFHHNQNKTMFSLHTAVDDGSSRIEKVKVTSIDTFFKENKIEKCDFMKIDIEGSEFELVCSDKFAEIAPKIETVFLEYHTWAGRNPNQLTQALEEYGFKVTQPQSTAGLLAGTR